MIGGGPKSIGKSTPRRGRRHRREHLHFATPARGRRRPRAAVVALAVVVVLAVAAAGIRAATAPAPELSSQVAVASALTLSGQPPAVAWPASGQAALEVGGVPLGSHGGDTPVPIASLAKMMTAYVVLQDHPLPPGQSGFSVTVDSAEVADYNQRLAQAQSVVAVAAGEKLSELQLLEGLLVPSGNNFATILADYDAGSAGAFVARMNTDAARLGLTHTHYTDPDGLSDTTVSTAADQLVLAAKVMSIPVFAQIVAMPTVDLPVAGVVDNYNSAVGTGGFFGIKTGSDSQAGGCLAFANHQDIDGRPTTILGVVLGQDTGTMSTPVLLGAAVKASEALVASARSAVTARTVVASGTVVAVVSNPQGRRVDLATADPIDELAYPGERVPLELTMTRPGRTLKVGQPMGRLVAGATGASAPVVAEATMPAVSFTWKLLHDL